MKKSRVPKSKKALLVTTGFIILFLISFSTSAFIYIRSNDLVFSSNLEEVEELTEKLSESEDTIVDLEEQLERYKTLYETAIRDASFTPPAPTRTPAPSSLPAPTRTPTATGTPKPQPTLPAVTEPEKTPERTPTPTPTMTPIATPSPTPIPTPPPFVEELE